MSRIQDLVAFRRLTLTFAKASKAHEEHPERNEDYGLVDSENRLAVICDGVGSVQAAAGAGQAARLAARTVRDHWRRVLTTLAEEPAWPGWQKPDFDLEIMLSQLLTEANQAVAALDARLVKRARKKVENDQESGKKQDYAATTIALVLLLPQEDGYLMGYAHIGDSRVYLLRNGEPLLRLTADDGYFEWKIGKGELNAADAWRIEQSTCAEQLSAEDREHFDKRNKISQSLGDKAITLHTGQITVRAGDRVLLTTDGSTA